MTQFGVADNRWLSVDHGLSAPEDQVNMNILNQVNARKQVNLRRKAP